MTRKDYEVLAEEIRNAHEGWASDEDRAIARRTMLSFVENLEDYLEQDNPRFDSDKFREACGL